MKTLAFAMIFIFSLVISECDQKPCFADRAISKKIESVKLTCTISGDLTLLEDLKKNTRYSVCNGEAFELKDAAIYTVSGIIYEIKPNERWPGTPFEITKLKNLE